MREADDGGRQRMSAWAVELHRSSRGGASLVALLKIRSYLVSAAQYAPKRAHAFAVCRPVMLVSYIR